MSSLMHGELFFSHAERIECVMLSGEYPRIYVQLRKDGVTPTAMVSFGKRDVWEGFFSDVIKANAALNAKLNGPKLEIGPFHVTVNAVECTVPTRSDPTGGPSYEIEDVEWLDEEWVEWFGDPDEWWEIWFKKNADAVTVAIMGDDHA